MAGLDIALNTGMRSLMVRQRELSTTGNNIANADKAGFHRRTTEVKETPAIESINDRIGTGVEVERVTRAYDVMLEKNLRQAVNKDGYHQRYTGILEITESNLASEGDSTLQQAVTDFADAWQDVGTQPESGEQRKVLIERGKKLAQEINLNNSHIASVKEQIWNGESGGYLKEAVRLGNNKAEEIAKLNESIREFERRQFKGEQANDLRDQRDQLVKELSAIADITVSEGDYGVKNVSMDGRQWVAGGEVEDSMQVAADGEVEWSSDNTTISQDGGEVQALVDSYDLLESVETDFNDFAATMASELNSQHASGFDFNGNSGGDLFQNTADGWQFQITNGREIAASDTAGAQGNGDNARALWDKMHENGLWGGSNDSIVNFVDRRIDELAADVQNAKELTKGTEGQVEMLEKELGDVSGVSVDQEMGQMLETQRAYQASARFVTVIDDMLASAIRMV